MRDLFGAAEGEPLPDPVLKPFASVLAWCKARPRPDNPHRSRVDVRPYRGESDAGWMVSIDLDGTDLASAAFEPVEYAPEAGLWLAATVDDGRFSASCSPEALPAAFSLFAAWTRRAAA